jgi:hypothetical protein
MDPITRLYNTFREQAEPWAIASTSLDALASDIADLIGDQTAAGYPTAADGSIDLYAIARQVQQMAAADPSTLAHWRSQPRQPITPEDLYKLACYRHWAAQQPWDGKEVAFWQGCAAGLAWLLKSRGLMDAVLAAMEADGIALGKLGRWAGIIETIDQPDGTVPHED